jgi:hypothetical protein
MMNVARIFNSYAEYHYAKCCYARCRCVKCHGTDKTSDDYITFKNLKMDTLTV